jgi:hypothetical protein
MLKRINFLLLLPLLSSPVFAEEEHICVPIDGPKTYVKSHQGEWTDLNKAQFNFLQGIYAVNPKTPPGLPPGDKAALATIQDAEIIFFLDGTQACDPMPVPKALIELLQNVGKGAINHLGTEN